MITISNIFRRNQSMRWLSPHTHTCKHTHTNKIFHRQEKYSWCAFSVRKETCHDFSLGQTFRSRTIILRVILILKLNQSRNPQHTNLKSLHCCDLTTAKVHAFIWCVLSSQPREQCHARRNAAPSAPRSLQLMTRSSPKLNYPTSSEHCCHR